MKNKSRNELKRDKIIVFHGEVSTPRKLFTRGAAFLIPGFLWVALFLFIPLLVLAVISFAQRGVYGGVEWVFSFANFKRLLGFGFFGWSADNLIIIGRSIKVSLITTSLCVLFSYPLSLFIASRPPRKRGTYLVMILVPFWTNLVIRTYAWQLVLGANQPFARILVSLGLLAPDTALYPSAFAVYIGMLSTFLPFVALPLYAAVEKMDWNLIEAVADLYGGKTRTFIHGVLPQTMPGLSVGITLTLIPAMGMFVIPDMLSGAKYMLAGNLIQQQITTAMDWPFGAMISLALMVMTLVTLFFTHSRSLDKKEKK
jgi:spermidine/putrescine transport system permease protein